jgi:hypothetical protein
MAKEIKMNSKKKRKVVKTKSYEIKKVVYDDGIAEFEIKNDGFKTIELIATLETVKFNVLRGSTS